MRIIITGTPCTGKSTLARRLSKLMGLQLISITDFVRIHALLEKGSEVDIRDLADAIVPVLRASDEYIVEGHLACEMRLPSDHVIVLRSPPKVLRPRLRRRGYRESKIEENLMAEMLDYCGQRVQAVYRIKPLEMDTSLRTLPSCAARIIHALKHKKKKIDLVNYRLEEYLGLR